MACKYMIFLPIFIVIIIHRIVFSSHYRKASTYVHLQWQKIMTSLRFRQTVSHAAAETQENIAEQKEDHMDGKRELTFKKHQANEDKQKENICQ